MVNQRPPQGGVDLRDVYQEKKRNAALLSALAAVHAQCVRAKERQHTALQLHARLNKVFVRATASVSSQSDDRGRRTAILGDARRVGAFTALVDAFHVTLKRHIKLQTNIVRRVLHHRLFSLQLRSIHHQLTAFLHENGADADRFPVHWRAAFETALRQDEVLLSETLNTVVKSTSFLSNEYLLLKSHEQMEALLNVQSELMQTVDRSPVLLDCLKLIYRSLVKLFHWDLSEKARLVPRWFTPTPGVEFSASKDLLTKLKPTYRGEIAIEERGGLKRHLATMKCFPPASTGAAIHVDETVQILEAYSTKYGAVDHPHVLRVRGANYVATPPFVLRDYATQGTLSGHLARTRHAQRRRGQFDEALAWRLLADACEGLLYIHEHSFVTHGGLRGSNLLVNHRGRACIADCGVRVLRERLGVAPSSDEDEYVRWLAPELLDVAHVQSTMAADVYAFGMSILEVLTGDKPWMGLGRDGMLEMKRADAGALPPQPSVVSTHEWRLIKKMCAADPAARLPLREVFEALVKLSQGVDGEVVPPSRVVADEETNEFETESISSYKTTVEITDLPDLVTVEKHEADSLFVEPENASVNVEHLDEQESLFELLVDTFDALSMGDSPSAMSIALQTNGQMKNAIEFLSDAHESSSPQELLPHLRLLRAFAKEEAQAIHESGGIRVLNAIFTKHDDTPVRSTTLEIYSAMLASGHRSVADALVDQGVVALVFDFFGRDGSLEKPHADVCVSLLLDLMGQSDKAKRQLGDADKKYVAALELNPNVHHRLVTEIKSVLARFKQTEGNEMLKEGFHALAVQRFTEAIQLDRRRGIYYADRSLAFCHGRRYHEAAEDAERCIRYNPFDAQGYLRYGLAMKHLKKYSEALSALRKGYQVNPNHAQLTAVMDEVQQLYNQQKAR